MSSTDHDSLLVDLLLHHLLICTGRSYTNLNFSLLINDFQSDSKLYRENQRSTATNSKPLSKLIKIMASTKGDISPEPTENLGTLLLSSLSNGAIDEEMLKLYAEKGLLDIPDEDGRMPLMIACLAGFEDVVKFLLDNGANPNSKSLTEAATPLHYACTVMTRGDKLGEIDSYYNQSDIKSASRVPIIKLLLSYGAKAVENIHGWSPTCVAAFYLQKDAVDYFLAIDEGNIPLEEKIKVAELLGVSNTLMFKNTDCDDIYRDLSMAIFIQQDATLQRAKQVTSDLEKCFSEFSWKECHTEEELQSIKESKEGLKAHAFLIAERLYPQVLKQRYLYPLLLRFADDLYDKEMWDEFYQVLSCAIEFEHQEKLKLGSVAEKLDDHYYGFKLVGQEPNDRYLQHVRNLLWKYQSVLQRVHIDSLSANVDAIIKSFGEILFSEVACYSPTADGLQSILLPIERSVSIIRDRIRLENPNKFHEIYSVAYELMSLLYQSFDHFKKFQGGIIANSLPRVRFVILKILFSEGARHTDRVGDLHVLGETLLHLVAKCARYAQGSVFQDSEYLQDLARAFIRHGCPIDAVNADGKTAKAVFEDDNPPDQDIVVWSLLRPSKTMLTLEEIVIRTILRHDVFYQEALPKCLCRMIDYEYRNLTL